MSISSLSLSSHQRPNFAEMRDNMFKKADTDGSGSISKDELKTMMANTPKRPGETQRTESADDLFGKIDTDGNGEISKAENDTFTEAREAEMTAEHGDQGEGGVGAFTGSTDLLKSLLDALKKLDDETDSSNSTQSVDTQAEKEKLIAALFEHLRQQDSQYTTSGVTTTDTTGALFNAKV